MGHSSYVSELITKRVFTRITVILIADTIYGTEHHLAHFDCVLLNNF